MQAYLQNRTMNAMHKGLQQQRQRWASTGKCAGGGRSRPACRWFDSGSENDGQASAMAASINTQVRSLVWPSSRASEPARASVVQIINTLRYEWHISD